MKRNSNREAPGTARLLLVIVGVFVVVGGIAGFAIYRDRIAPFRTTVLVVDDTSIKMGYFLKRVHLADREPLEMLQVLIREQVIAQVAAQPPYNIQISEQDIDQMVRDAARGGAETITDREVQEWYRQERNASQLSDAEFRDLIRRNVRAQRMSEYLRERVPTVAEQVHLYLITQTSPEAAASVAAQVAAGADFFELAREANADERLRARGGDLGWRPREALSGALAGVFDLAVGEVSGVVPLGEQAFAVIMVAERAAAREVEGEALETVKANALNQWFQGEYQYHHVEFHGFTNGYDTETDLWVKWQLQRMGR